jgi:hypothetical protein
MPGFSEGRTKSKTHFYKVEDKIVARSGQMILMEIASLNILKLMEGPSGYARAAGPWGMSEPVVAK